MCECLCVCVCMPVYICIYIYTIKSPKWALCTLSGPAWKILNSYVDITHMPFLLVVLSNGIIRPMIHSR